MSSLSRVWSRLRRDSAAGVDSAGTPIASAIASVCQVGLHAARRSRIAVWANGSGRPREDRRQPGARHHHVRPHGSANPHTVRVVPRREVGGTENASDHAAGGLWRTGVRHSGEHPVPHSTPTTMDEALEDAGVGRTLQPPHGPQAHDRLSTSYTCVELTMTSWNYRSSPRPWHVAPRPDPLPHGAHDEHLVRAADDSRKAHAAQVVRSLRSQGQFLPGPPQPSCG